MARLVQVDPDEPPQSIITAVRAYSLAKLLTQAISWAGTIFVVRSLDATAFGLFGISVVVINYASLIFDGGIAEALVQMPPQTRDESRAVFTMLLYAGLAIAFVVALLGTIIGGVVDEPRVAPVIMAMSLALLMSAVSVLPYANLANRMQFGQLGRIDAVQALITTLITVGFAYAGFRIWALVVGFVAGSVLRALLLNIAVRGMLTPIRELRQAARYLRFGSLVFVESLLWLWYTSIDAIFLGRWSGAAALGYYRLGQELAHIPLERLSTVVNQVALPSYASLGADQKAAGNLTIEAIRTHAVVGFPVFWGMAMVAPMIISITLGDRWQGSAFALRAFAVIAPLRLIGSIESPAMTGSGRPAILVKTKLGVAVGMTVALAIGCKAGGTRGAALAWALVFPVLYLLSFRYILRALGLTYAHVLRIVTGPATAAILMVAAVSAGRWFTQRMNWSLVSALIGCILFGIMIYVTALRLIDRQAFSLTKRRIGQLLWSR